MKRLIYSCRELDTLDKAARALAWRHLDHWRWTVVSDRPGLLQHRGFPLASLWQRKALLSCSLKGGFWGLVLGAVTAAVLVNGAALPAGELRSTALWSLPICGTAFGAWLGGLLGLSRDRSALQAYLPEVAAGHYLVLITVAAVDERMVKQVMAACQLRKLGEQCVGLSWQSVFPAVGEGRA